MKMTEIDMEKNEDSDSEVGSSISDDMQNESSSEDEQENIDEQKVLDSDEELQEALAAGLLKPGLNTVIEKREERKLINNVEGLKQKTSELAASLKHLPWIERLDHVALKLAPLAPELALKEEEHEKKRQKNMKIAGVSSMDHESDSIHNDFKRELIFYRQAQATVLEVLPRLQSMGVPTKRPEDYFAQMAKTDDHMNKVREKLVSKQATEEKLEKVRKLRDLKKFGKKVQQEVAVKRQKEKREMLDQVKKFRKGQADSIDFLQQNCDDDGIEQGGPFKRKTKPTFQSKNGEKTLDRRNYKDKKFGFGGKKKGGKMNTKDSVNDISGYRRPKLPGGSKANKAGFHGSKKGGKNQRNQRYGKMRRQKSKHGKK